MHSSTFVFASKHRDLILILVVKLSLIQWPLVIYCWLVQTIFIFRMLAVIAVAQGGRRYNAAWLKEFSFGYHIILSRDFSYTIEDIVTYVWFIMFTIRYSASLVWLPLLVKCVIQDGRSKKKTVGIVYKMFNNVDCKEQSMLTPLHPVSIPQPPSDGQTISPHTHWHSGTPWRCCIPSDFQKNIIYPY